MILNFGGNFIAGRELPTRKILCSAADINSEQLRAQLDKLHSEAEHTRAKANNARLRLMRLSEAAEKLRRQAARDLQTERENDARELLFQKKKVMQALEKSKTRVTLLDELSSKLNEAIAAKETQLIENVSSDLDIGREEASTTVRIVSPKDEESGNPNEEDLDWNTLKSGEDQGLQVYAECQADLPIGSSADKLTGSLIGDTRNEGHILNCLKEIRSYAGFMEHLDQQLDKIEEELVTVLRVSTLVMEDQKIKKLKLSRVQQTVELLQGIRRIRERISSIVHTERGSHTASL